MKNLEQKITMKQATIFVLLLVSFYIQKAYTTEIKIISGSQFLTENDTLVSPAGTFELGFFSPGSSENRYLGIWYKKISVKTVVWVANRDSPLTGTSSGVLRIIRPGNLALTNENTNDVIWSSSNVTSPSSENVIATLDETGNLVMIKDKKIVWESFDYPTDTLLAGMRFGKNFLTGKEWHLSAWKNSQDPGTGELTYSVDTRGYPQDILKQNGVVKFRAGPWNGVRFSGASDLSKNLIFTYNMVINETEEAFTYNLLNENVVSRFTLNSTGLLERTVWVEDSKKWQLIVALPRDICDSYNICGAYGSCSIVNSQTCSCLNEANFVPRNQKAWEAANWSGGCVRRVPLDCKNGTDGFIKYSNVKSPETESTWFNKTMDLKECEAICQKNCSCMAYANTDIRDGGKGCLLWFSDLIDTRVYSEGRGGQDVYVRMAASELLAKSNSIKKKGADIKITLAIALVAVLVIGIISTLFWYAWRKRNYGKLTKEEESSRVCASQKEAMDAELPLFRFSVIAKATSNFSPEHKLGEGGFGPVYKGVLEEGQEIAVKRLSKTSSQGVDEFKNEVICISKLQHRNLVKLLGCSIQEEEKLLIYEYMPNKSLDSFIFDETQSTRLDWAKRFDIIKGIARGLLYLHQDSRLRIIHRDLKASNILLDLDMNPKISDFGIARSFGGNETQANTERVVGTYGYMSPEYALDGRFSTKSDVYSFGVLVLEIVSGKRNRGFVHPDHDNNLIGHAWRLHNEGRSMELVDTTLDKSTDPSEVIRSIEVGLICVQQSPDDRPNMSSVVLVLGNEGALPKPKQPAFFTERNVQGPDFSSSTWATSSTNDLTVTEVVPR